MYGPPTLAQFVRPSATKLLHLTCDPDNACSRAATMLVVFLSSTHGGPVERAYAAHFASIVWC